MKIGRFTLSVASLALLVIQLALVSIIAAKYLYQRWTCPRVWTRAAAADPKSPLHGRYLSLQLTVNGCASTLPSAKNATFPRDVNGAVKPGPYVLKPQPVDFLANLKVINNSLTAVRIEGQEETTGGVEIVGSPGATCDQMRLGPAIDCYLSGAARNPFPLQPGQELWIEVTVPPKGLPQPIQLALKDHGAWKPLNLQ